MPLDRSAQAWWTAYLARLQEAIEQQTQAERTLRSSEQQYRLLAENVQDGIAIVQQRAIVFTNTVLTAMLNVPPESLLNSDPASLFHIDAFETPTTEEMDGQGSRPVEALWQNPDQHH